MTTDNWPGARRRRRMAQAGLIIAPAVALTACGSAAVHAASVSATAVRSACTEVSATLADGPDSGTDPVGYAEAQVGPLHAIRTSDPALRTAISKLASAYARVYASNGTSPAAAKAVTAAAGAIDAICPGATS
jgi:hypothetical protein